MSRWTRVGLALLVLVMLGLSVWLFTLDVHAERGGQYGGQERSPVTRSYCGSAYDVVLLRGHGFMGGEVPLNQRAIDEECIREAGRAVAAGSALGASALALSVTGLLAARRKSSSRTRDRRGSVTSSTMLVG